MLDNTLLFFFEEADGHIQAMEKGLRNIRNEEGNPREEIEEIFRAAHTLKGTAALMKQAEVSELAHLLEDILERAMESGILPKASQIDAMRQSLGTVRVLVEAAAGGRDVPLGIHYRALALLESAAAAPQNSETAVPGDPAPERRDFEPQIDLEDLSASVQAGASLGGSNLVKIGNDKLETLMNLVGGVTVIKSQLLRQASELDQIKFEIESSGTRLVKEVDGFSERYAYALPERLQPTQVDPADFQELEFDQYDEINLFSRKLEEITDDINEAMRSMGGFFSRLSDQMESLDRSIVEIRERVADIRTVRAENLLRRFSSVTTELFRHKDKKIRLACSGGETPLDRVIFDGLYDPLLHLLRNAASHGIETQEQRAWAGKPDTGTIHLEFRRKGNAVEIEVRDDGRGIDLEAVRGRAIGKGLLKQGETPDQRDLMQLIFRPGFTTLSQSDATSGRGMGMNIVQDRLAALNGTVEIISEQGRGTSVLISLPLSLMVINVVEFLLGEQSFVIPTNQVTEIIDLELDPRDGIVEGDSAESCPTLNLNEVFGIAPSTEKSRFAILTRCEGRPLRLLVEKIVRQEDCLIKPLAPFLNGLPHVAGTSISGEGHLRLVLNPAQLLAATHQPVVPAAAVKADKQTVLLVDDSLSVRKVATQILESGGFAVLTAPNGREALNSLEQHSVDLVITDLEMPLMHGYELLSQIKQSPRAALPVAVLSSRATRQHRQKALDLGACDYLVKPFDTDSLLKAVHRHLQPA